MKTAIIAGPTGLVGSELLQLLLHDNRYSRVVSLTRRDLNVKHPLHIFRPSLLLGNRKKRRMGEAAAKVFFRVFGFLIPRKYKGIQARTVAQAMITSASAESKGTFVHESNEIHARWSAHNWTSAGIPSEEERGSI